MLPDFESRWNGHLDRVRIEKHWVQLPAADAKPIYSAPYQAGPCAQELEKLEIAKMFCKEIIEPA